MDVRIILKINLQEKISKHIPSGFPMYTISTVMKIKMYTIMYAKVQKINMMYSEVRFA